MDELEELDLRKRFVGDIDLPESAPIPLRSQTPTHFP
jgi:hypothetical protein